MQFVRSAYAAGACLLVFFLISCAAVVRAAEDYSQFLGAGCHLASPQEKAEMVARGIPESFQVCPNDQRILGIGRNFEQWYAQLKTQRPCDSNNPRTLAYRTRNTGAQVCGPTASRWNAIGCHPNNRTAIFPTVSHGFAAHIELLRRYCGERGRCTIGRVIEQWTATVGDRPAYASFVSRNAGMPVNQVFDPNDIDLMGRIALAMSCFESGSMPYNPAELKQGLVMAGGGKRVPVPANVGQLLNESLQGGYGAYPSGSPASHPGSWGYPASSLTGNRYAPPPPPPQPLPIMNPQSTGATPASSSQNTDAGQIGVQQQPYGQVQAAQSVPVNPAAFIIVQPPEVQKGKSLVVSWTSVGMDTGNSCKVITNEQVVSQMNEGSAVVSTSVFTEGSAIFKLQCVSLGGAEIEKSASAKVL